MVDMQFVQSSNVESVGYDKEKQELHVRFLGTGATYIYFGVPEELYDGLLQANSVGSYLNRNIKGTYQYTKA